MSIDATTQLMSKHHLSDSFHKINETESPEACRTTDKVHRLLCQNGLTAKKLPESPQKSNIAPLSADAKDLVVKPIIINKIDEDVFQKAFSWRVTRQDYPDKKINFKDVPDSNSISYKDDIPQFDKSWNLIIYKTVTYAVKQYKETEPFHSDDKNNTHLKIYRDHAQILLDRFLKNHPAFKGSKNRPIHQALMLQAIATAIKVDEECGIYHSDFADCLNDNRSESLVRDLHQMERLFLKGIDWNISYST